MNTSHLKRFAREARIKLIDQIGAKLEKVLTADSAELREKTGAIKKLQEAINATDKAQVVETVAYTWFNRLVALRFMDVNGYEPIGIKVVSPGAGATLPELLQEAKAGNIAEDLKVNHQRIFDLLDGKIPATDAQTEAYRELLVGACNHLHSIFPFLFERINDYSELLLPDDLLSEFSIIEDIKTGMAAEDCQEVEILGWLYQFYISEKKDEVFASKSKVKKEDIPAATQLFTPRWIVEYMVQNTVGKLWLQNNPKSQLREHMPYFIESASVAPSGENGKKQPDDYLKINSVEEITLLDQACGSGHILVYGFELLSKIYEEEGYNETEIPKLIIEKNLYGFEIDQRAAQLAGLALMLKARSYQRRFFRKEVTPNILCYQDLNLTVDELKEAFAQIDIELTDELLNDLKNMQQATNLGSLIMPHAELATIIKTSYVVKKKLSTTDVFLKHKLIQIEVALEQLILLGKKHHCVVDNPPYMGGGNMNKEMADFVKTNYPESKSDLMACFMEAGLAALQPKGFLGMINQHSWMFLSSYEKLREKLIQSTFFDTLLHLGPRTFPEIGGEVVQNASFTFWNTTKDATGSYVRLVDEDSPKLKQVKTIEAIQDSNCSWFYNTNQKDFQKITGSPICYWPSDQFFKSFDSFDPLDKIAFIDGKNVSGNNAKHFRMHWEIERKNFITKYIPTAKGGDFRKWQGNTMHLVDWSEKAKNEYKSTNSGRLIKPYLWFRIGLTFSRMSKIVNCRIIDKRGTFDGTTVSFFLKKEQNEKTVYFLQAFFNSNVGNYFVKVINPTLVFQFIDIKKIPICYDGVEIRIINESNEISREEWCLSEYCIDYQQNEIIRIHKQDASIACTPSLEETYDSYCQYWQKKFFELHKNEEELNRQFIEIYGLEDVLTPDVPLEDVTILKDELDQKKLKQLSATYSSNWKLVDGGWKMVDGEQSSTSKPQLPFDAKEIVKQFVSYAVGCMFGRYSLDKPGLILANQGETIADYMSKVNDRWMENGEWQTNENNLNQEENDKRLQGVADLAAEHDPGDPGLSTDETDAEGRTLQSDGSDKTGSREHSEQHSRGTSEGNERVSSLSEDSSGLIVRTGNTTDDSDKSQNAENRGDTAGGNGDNQSEKTNTQPIGKTALNQQPSTSHHQPSTNHHQPSTSHQPPSTNHQSPSTNHHQPITFLPDDDNIIPVLDNEWFEDDIVGRFYQFLKVTFGKDNFEKNLTFVEDTLGRDIRNYFLKDFYTDHIRRYKKRPIYWLFSSPSGAFNALIYMHRYTPNTLNQILNGYLKAYREKLQAELNHQTHLQTEGTAREQTLAAKEESRINKVLLELQEYEREVYKLATDRIEIDLDDGVLVNYNKFGKIIKEVSGLNDKKAKAKVRKFDWIDTTQII